MFTFGLLRKLNVKSPGRKVAKGINQKSVASLRRGVHALGDMATLLDMPERRNLYSAQLMIESMVSANESTLIQQASKMSDEAHDQQKRRDPIG